MPEAQDLDLSRRFYKAIVEMISNPSEVQPTHAGQGHVSGASSHFRLDGNERRCAIKIFSNRVGRPRSVDAPPLLGRTNLPGSDGADRDFERFTHSRLRSSERSCFIGIVSPRLH